MNVPVRGEPQRQAAPARAQGPITVPNTRDIEPLNTAFAALSGFTTAAERDDKARRRALVRAALVRHGLLPAGAE